MKNTCDYLSRLFLPASYSIVINRICIFLPAMYLWMHNILLFLPQRIVGLSIFLHLRQLGCFLVLPAGLVAEQPAAASLGDTNGFVKQFRPEMIVLTNYNQLIKSTGSSNVCFVSKTNGQNRAPIPKRGFEERCHPLLELLGIPL